MFACRFLQLRGDKGVDYCLTGSFYPPPHPLDPHCCKEISVSALRRLWYLYPFDLGGGMQAQLLWAWPVWRFKIGFMEPAVMDSTSVAVVTWGFISLRGCVGGGVVTPSTSQYLQWFTHKWRCVSSWGTDEGKIINDDVKLGQRRRGSLLLWRWRRSKADLPGKRRCQRASSFLFREARYRP